MYAGTEFSGVYKTINGGITWEPAQTGMEGNRINSLIIHPTDSDILYAGVLDDGPYKSTDGGQTWEKLKYQLQFGGAHGSSPARSSLTPIIRMSYSSPMGAISTSHEHPGTIGENFWRLEGLVNLDLHLLNCLSVLMECCTIPANGEISLVGRVDPETNGCWKTFLSSNAISSAVGTIVVYNEVVAFSEETGRMFVSFLDYMYYSEDGGQTWISTGKGCVRAEFFGNGNGLCIEITPNTPRWWIDLESDQLSW